jgi:hypothetical protein
VNEALSHQSLRARLERLEATAHEQLGLLSAFAALQEFLSKHFAHEEGPGGFFARIRNEAPMHVEQVDVLEREHASLLASARFIAGRVETLQPEELQAEVREFIALVRAHEIAEGVLYQDALGR